MGSGVALMAGDITIQCQAWQVEVRSVYMRFCKAGHFQGDGISKGVIQYVPAFPTLDVRDLDL